MGLLDKAYLCLFSDIPNNGFHCVSLFGKNLVVSRSDENISVDENRCRHRGYPIAAGSGELPLKCGYHGLAFSPSFSVESSRVGDFIFMGTKPTELDGKLLSFSDGIGRQFWEYSQFVKCPFELWVQNTMDPNHLKTVHADSFFGVFNDDRPSDVRISISGLTSSYVMSVGDFVVRKYNKILSREFIPEFFHMSVFPHLSITDFLGVFKSVETAIPFDGGCWVRTRFFLSLGIEPPTSLLLAARNANMRILEEDKDVCERWAVTYDSRRESQWLKNEDRIRNYARTLSDALSTHRQKSTEARS